MQYADERTVLGRDDGRCPRRVLVDERQLPEALARPEPRHRVAVDDDVDGAKANHKELFSDIPLCEDRLALMSAVGSRGGGGGCGGGGGGESYD